MMALAGKAITLVFWGFVVAAGLGMFREAGQDILLMGVLVVAMHLFEVFLMLTRWKEQVKPQPIDIPLVIIFGAFHLKPRLQGTNKDQ